jgi:hypothetical protein
MKKTFSSMFLLALMLMTLISVTSFAQGMDTLVVAAYPLGNLNNVINSDTTNGGFIPPNRVYKIQQTGAIDTVYWLSAPIFAKGDIRVVGEVNPVTGKPPVVAPDIAEDNTSIGYFFEPQGDCTLELHGIYFLGKRIDGLVTTGQFILPAGDNIDFIIDNCILENISGEGTPDLVDAWGYVGNNYYITNCEFRNCQGDIDQTPGFAWFGAGDYPCDTAKFVNNTFFIFAGSVLGADDFGAKYLEFDHNTYFFSTQQGAFSIPQMTNSVITNNIFFSVSSASIPEEWYEPAGWATAVINIDSLSSLTGDPWNLTEGERNITITNNAYFWPQEILDKWDEIDAENIPGVSPLHRPTFINAAPDLLTDKTTWPNVNVENNWNIDPGFNAALATEAGEAMAAFIDVLWHNDQVGANIRPFVGASDGIPTWVGVPADWKETQNYPVPENLKYTNAELMTAGTDGLPLGDLNWFPGITGIKQISNNIPTEFSLSQNYPNPFNPTTEIQYSIPKSGFVTLKVYNVLGQEVMTLVNQQQTAGSYKVNFSASNLASGIYMYSVESGNVLLTKKMVLLK